MNAKEAVLAREAAKKPPKPVPAPKRSRAKVAVEAAVELEPDAKVFVNEPVDG